MRNLFLLSGFNDFFVCYMLILLQAIEYELQDGIVVGFVPAAVSARICPGNSDAGKSTDGTGLWGDAGVRKTDVYERFGGGLRIYAL